MATDISGAVLVGGASRRMGQDKAMMRFGGAPLIARAVEALRPVVQEILIVGRRAARFAWLPGVHWFEDILPPIGPLAGIYTALQYAQSPYCLIVACDMPFLNPSLLSFLADAAGGWDAVVPEIDGRLQPLHAVYGRSCLPAIEEMLAVGQHCPLDLYPRVRTRFVTAEELRIVDRRLLSFLNVNTPAEWQTALALLEEQTVRASCSHLP